LPNNSLSYPKVCRRYDGLYYIDFKLNNKRYRMFSGAKINSSLSPNSYPAKLKRHKTELLAKEVYNYLVRNNYSFKKKLNSTELYDSLISSKLSEPLSTTYYNTLKDLADKLRCELISKGEISTRFLDGIILRHKNNTSYNTTRRHLNVLINYLYDNGFPIHKSKLKTRKQEEVLHKPISDVSGVLELVKSYNNNLHICCLLTYGCLLRPHQEIRLLKWGDFSDDLSHIRLSGGRVKSKRNRVVPVPLYVRKQLVKGNSNDNIFTGSSKPYNRSYFSLVWKRFKRLYKEIDSDITLYSFRHTGAIEIFKRTGSLHKLQRAMGHSSINVSLTYLRGLEVAELKEEDMPVI
jgi:integrase